ncbi:hypothetical protein SO694_0009205 [Aureococcus anophagefferens]|uniref:Uncharacterized protein n=1 Tax=Aureococcus anophagefferens TaxID=44056 RepID=A0ABR1FS82_AURAN
MEGACAAPRPRGRAIDGGRPPPGRAGAPRTSTCRTATRSRSSSRRARAPADAAPGAPSPRLPPATRARARAGGRLLLLGRGLGGLALLLGLGRGVMTPTATVWRMSRRRSGRRRVRVRERLDAEGLRGREGGHARVAGLDELGVLLEHLAGAAVHLLVELLELARGVGRVAVEHGRVARRDLAGVVHDDDLGEEGVRALGRVLLGVAAHEAAAEVLDGDVLHVEAHVVAGHGLGSDSWCISTDLTSVESWAGANVTTMPGLSTPVSTRPATGTVPMPPIL